MSMGLAKRGIAELDVERACALLAECKTLAEAKAIRDQAKAYAVLLRYRRAGAEAAADGAEILARADVRLGELLLATEKRKGAREPGTDRGRRGDGSVTASLSDLLNMPTDGAKQLASRVQRLAKDEVKAEAYVARARARAARAVTTAEPGAAANHSSESIEWYTPGQYIESARAVLGMIDLDPASCAKANATVKAANYFEADDDGLAYDWYGRVWLNPPYGTEAGESIAGRWARKLIDEYRAGHTTAAILLVNAVTDREWFQPLWDFPICFTDHRIAFDAPAGEPVSPVSGNAFVYFGDELSAFVDHFSEHGVVVGRIANGIA